MDVRSEIKVLVEKALADGQKLGFDTSISICRKLAEDLKGDYSIGASVCADLIVKMRDSISIATEERS